VTSCATFVTAARLAQTLIVRPFDFMYALLYRSHRIASR
jgi:hypothetical protein